MTEAVVGNVLAIALRTGVRAPMRPVPEAVAVTDGGLEGDVTSDPARGITFLASGQWTQVIRALNAELPWHTRRANVLVACDRLLHLVGKTLRVGSLIVEVGGESKPCGLMDQLHPGLRGVLAVEGRGGVYGRIKAGGVLRVGDAVSVIRSDGAV